MTQSLNTIQLLWILFKKGKKCIFSLRGGLGNQLYQVYGCAQHPYLKDSTVLFTDIEVRKNPRDSLGAEVFKIEFNKWFSPRNDVYIAGKNTDFLIRLLKSKYLSKWIGLPTNFDLETASPARNIYLGFGYMQETKNHLPKDKFFAPFAAQEKLLDTSHQSRVALHIRGTDSLTQKQVENDTKYFRDALSVFACEGYSNIDVFTDDLQYARSITSLMPDLKFDFIEDGKKLSALEFLIAVSAYDKLVLSKSTLSWWSGALSRAVHSNSRIVFPGGNASNFPEWQ